MAASDKPSRQLLVLLTSMTAVSGLVDAVSYLGLGHVFTANMTGNVVVLGFAAAGASGFSVAACLTSLGAFVVGAACAGRAQALLPSRRRLLITALVTEGTLTATAAVVGFTAATFSTGWPRFTVIALLAFGMGVRNATIRRLAVPDMTTTVLTMTLTGLAADIGLTGAANPLLPRRASAVLAMLLGALAGALLFLHRGAGLTLLIGALVVLGGCAIFASSAKSRLLDKIS